MEELPLYLALGTNLGDRMSNIRTALQLLDIGLNSHYERLSTIVESEAQGFQGPAFLNCVVRYNCSIVPIDILKICKRIEREMGRTDEGVNVDESGARIYRDRVIDIDILRYGKIRLESQELTIPHPRIESRPFVKGPLEEITDKCYR